MKANVFQYKDASHAADISVTEKCIPINEIVRTKRWGTDLWEYFNFQEAIPDPAVFNPPHECHPREGSEHMLRRPLGFGKY